MRVELAGTGESSQTWSTGATPDVDTSKQHFHSKYKAWYATHASHAFFLNGTHPEGAQEAHKSYASSAKPRGFRAPAAALGSHALNSEKLSLDTLNESLGGKISLH